MSDSTFVAAVVIDASVAIAISAKEANREQQATSEMLRLANSGHLFYAPGAIVAETLYVLCGKVQSGLLTPAEHGQSILDFESLMQNILPPPNGEAVLICRAEAIRNSYGCSRSADGIYIALAEVLAGTSPTTILTFDQDMQKQAAKNARPLQCVPYSIDSFVSQVQ